ncbi:MAG: C39 family peptidase [Oscillospiraceae bacterium]|nr:C39 family peptidase [Oscillospiraceae bacterium]
MKKFINILSVICIFILLITFNNIKVANANAILRGIYTVKQAKSNWCWAACCESVGKDWYPSSNRDQWSVVLYLKGDTFPDVSGDIYDKINGAQYAAFYYVYLSAVNFNPDTVTYANIVNAMNLKSQNFIVDFGYYNANNVRGGGHSMVVYGYDDSNQSVYYMDPSTGLAYKIPFTSFRTCLGSTGKLERIYK